MSTLLQLYQENKLVKSISQKIYFANVNLFTKELLELAKELKKDIYFLASTYPSEDNAYKINNILYIIEYIHTIQRYLWRVKYIGFTQESAELKKAVEKFKLTKNFQEKLFQKFWKCIDCVSNIENENTLRSYAQISLEKLKEKKSKLYSKYQDSLKITCDKYLKEIHDYRESTGFVVLKSRDSSDWVSEERTAQYLANAEILKQKGPTLMIDNSQFVTNLIKLHYKSDREDFFHQALKADKINTLWNRTLLKKVQIAQCKGYDNYVDFATHKNVLNGKIKVQDYLNSKLKAYQPGYQHVMEQLLELSKKDGNNELKVSDIKYYLEALDNESDSSSKNYYFKLEDALKKLAEFSKKHLNISLKFRSLPKKGIHFWVILKDFENGQKGSLLITNLDSNSNFSDRSTTYFNQFKRVDSQSVINIDLKEDFISYYEMGVLFHEFGHVLQNFVSHDKYENLAKEIWELVEVPSMLLESLSKNYELLKDMTVYEDKETPHVLSLDIFNQLQTEDADSDFEKYMDNAKHLIMVEMYSKTYEEIKSINPSKYLNEKLIEAKIPYLWTDCDNNFMAEYRSDYGVMPYIYNFAQDIVDVLIEKIKENHIIEGNVASINYIFRNVLTNNDGISSIDKLKKIYQERNYATI